MGSIVWVPFYDTIAAYRNLQPVKGALYNAEMFSLVSEAWEQDKFLITNTYPSFEDAYYSIVSGILKDTQLLPEDFSSDRFAYQKAFPVLLVQILEPEKYGRVLVKNWNPLTREYSNEYYIQEEQMFTDLASYKASIVHRLDRVKDYYKRKGLL